MRNNLNIVVFFKLCVLFMTFPCSAMAQLRYGTMNKSYLLCLIFALLAAAASASFCGPSERECTVELRGQTHIACYSPTTHRCLESARILAPREHDTRCGDGTISSETHVCHRGGLVCPVSNPDVCGYSCYNSNELGCNRGVLTVLRH